MPAAGNYYVVTLRGDRGPMDRQRMAEQLRAGEIRGQDQVRNAFGRPLGTVAEVIGGDSRRMQAEPRAQAPRPVPHPHHPHHPAPAPTTGRATGLIVTGGALVIVVVGLAYLLWPGTATPPPEPPAPQTVPEPPTQQVVATPPPSVPEGQPGLRVDLYRLNYVPNDFPVLSPMAKSDWAGIATEISLDPCTKAGFNESFYARWQGRITIVSPGRYAFHLTSDDGSRLTIDDQVVVDNGGSHGMESKIGMKELGAGPHAIRIDYFNGQGGYGLRLDWQTGTAPTSPVPATALSHVGP